MKWPIIRVEALLLALLLVPITTYAATDYSCLKRCTGIGQSHSECLVKCGYDNFDPPPEEAAVLDRGCFKTCVKNNTEALSCMPQCSKIAKLSKPKRVTQFTEAEKHNVFDAPLPDNGEMILPPISARSAAIRYARPVIENTDPVCMQDCTRGKLVYGLCKERCAQ